MISGRSSILSRHSLLFFFLQVNQGTVLAVGPGRRSNTGDLIPPAVKEGDKVLLPEYGGTPVKLDASGDKE
jgi:chaperonin GroES